MGSKWVIAFDLRCAVEGRDTFSKRQNVTNLAVEQLELSSADTSRFPEGSDMASVSSLTLDVGLGEDRNYLAKTEQSWFWSGMQSAQAGLESNSVLVGPVRFDGSGTPSATGTGTNSHFWIRERLEHVTGKFQNCHQSIWPPQKLPKSLIAVRLTFRDASQEIQPVFSVQHSGFDGLFTSIFKVPCSVYRICGNFNC